MYLPLTAVLALTTSLFFGPSTTLAQEAASYGVDCSFPVFRKDFICGDLLGDRASVYEDYMQGCRDYFGKKADRCDSTEEDRLEMSMRQPISMVNYTDTGFKKLKAPKALFNLLKNHWEMNKDYKEVEQWSVGNVYVNHWKSPTYMVSVENSKLRGAGYQLKKAIWDHAKPIIEEWTGMELRETSMYGIRIYTDGAILSPHADRLPLVSSCIINVAQDVDEPWPLEVFDRQGNAVNVTMEPGDMVLYESGSLIHGRPFALKGKYFANIFIHFEPTGRKLGETGDEYLSMLDEFVPPYILPDSPEVANWVARNPGGWGKPTPSATVHQMHSPEAHVAAALGDIDKLMSIAQKNAKALHAKDVNGWQPLHEAARAGDQEVAALLVKHGVDLNARTGKANDGSSPLNIALMHHGAKHPITKYLISLGARDITSEL